MLAVIPVRDGELPVGALEAIAECDGQAMLVGDRLDAVDLLGVATDVRTVEPGPYAPATWAASLVEVLADESIIVLPASPDGRDLAPRLAFALGRQLVAGAVSIAPGRVTVARRGGLELHVLAVAPPIVATLQPGVRGIEPGADHGIAAVTRSVAIERHQADDATVVAVHPP
ncbi:MAG: mycofactocin-associated electron transfer flavoprotein alpha subunit, partial [Ilumatobacteraceae bacterium]